MRRTVLVAALFVASTAQAQQRRCSEYNHAGWDQDLDTASELLAAFDLDRAETVLGATYDQLPCLDRVALPSRLGRYAQLRAITAFFRQDEVSVVRWARLAEVTAPWLPWPAPITDDHPMMEILAEHPDVMVGGPDDASWNLPRGSSVFLDGHPSELPVSEVEVPHLVQIFDKKGELLQASWQDGTAFADDLFVAGSVSPVATPRWYIEEDPQGALIALGLAEAPVDGPTELPQEPTKTKKSPTLNVARLIIGGSLVAVAGGLYGGALASKGSLDNVRADGGDALKAGVNRTNTLAITSSVLGVAGIGVGVTAFISDGPGVGFGLRF